MPKIQLSAEEMQLVTNSDWILTKHRVIEKVYVLFGQLSEQMQDYLLRSKPSLPENILKISPKISKGEQYESLPYVVLDYPRFFSKKDVFAIRSFFWWGNYFSITLHLKGECLARWYDVVCGALSEGDWTGYYLSFGEDEFNFNLVNEAYQPVGSKAVQDFLAGDNRESPFLKISYKIALEQWDDAGQKILQAFERYMKITEAG